MKYLPFDSIDYLKPCWLPVMGSNAVFLTFVGMSQRTAGVNQRVESPGMKADAALVLEQVIHAQLWPDTIVFGKP